jgi:hypothetical protein
VRESVAVGPRRVERAVGRLSPPGPDAPSWIGRRRSPTTRALLLALTAAAGALWLGPSARAGEDPFAGIGLTVSATDETTHTTRYEVHFADPAREAQRAAYGYNWTLSFPTGDSCAARPLTVEPQLWRASWTHSDCTHRPGERVAVGVGLSGATVWLGAPALGPATGTITPGIRTLLPLLPQRAGPG